MELVGPTAILQQKQYHLDNTTRSSSASTLASSPSLTPPLTPNHAEQAQVARQVFPLRNSGSRESVASSKDRQELMRSLSSSASLAKSVELMEDDSDEEEYPSSKPGMDSRKPGQ